MAEVEEVVVKAVGVVEAVVEEVEGGDRKDGAGMLIDTISAIPHIMYAQVPRTVDMEVKRNGCGMGIRS